MKPLGWVGSAKDDLLAFPEDVVREIGRALYVAQLAGKQKGISTPKSEMDKIRARLKRAEEEHEAWAREKR